MKIPISFGSIYKVVAPKKSNLKNYNEFSKFSDNIVENGLGYIKKEDNESVQKSKTLIVPDCMDSDVESFCFYNGIMFKKYSNKV